MPRENHPGQVERDGSEEGVSKRKCRCFDDKENPYSFNKYVCGYCKTPKVKKETPKKRQRIECIR